MILYDILLILIYFLGHHKQRRILNSTGSDSTHFNSLVNLLNSLKNLKKKLRL